MRGKKAKALRKIAREMATVREPFSGELVVTKWAVKMNELGQPIRYPASYAPCRHAGGTYRRVLKAFKRLAR